MPLGPGVKYRVKTYPSGKKIRLAFRGSKVIETKNLATGDTHTMVGVLAGHIRKRKSKRY